MPVNDLAEASGTRPTSVLVPILALALDPLILCDEMAVERRVIDAMAYSSKDTA